LVVEPIEVAEAVQAAEAAAFDEAAAVGIVAEPAAVAVAPQRLGEAVGWVWAGQRQVDYVVEWRLGRFFDQDQR